jgi:hypothetical protein
MERMDRASVVDGPCAARRARRFPLAAHLFPALGALWLTGCAGGGGDPARPTHVISGKVSASVSGAVTAGVSLALSGPGVVAASATTRSDGTYQFDGYPDGEYTVTPNLAGSLFLPVSRTVTVAANDAAGADFATAPEGTTASVDAAELAAASASIGAPTLGYTVGLTNWTGSGLADIAAQAWIEQGTARRKAGWAAVADACAPPSTPGILLPGACTFGGFLDVSNAGTGTGTLAPGSATLAVELVQGAAATVLHTLRVPITLTSTRSVSGRIVGATGVSFQATAAGYGASWGLYTGGADTYSLTGLPAGLVTVTPSKNGYTFSPATRVVDVGAADATGVDFTAAP